MRWTDLLPEPGIVEALDLAGTRPESGDQNAKRRWSENFANGCALAVAAALRRTSLGSKRILPESLGGTEPLTPLGSLSSKRIDVTVVDVVLGLEVGVSLKGLNFRDRSSGHHDKNLTGRLYELADEVRLVHEHLPHAYMVGLFFLPLDACRAKVRDDAGSSFANTVLKLRNRTGRLDVALPSHAPRCDAAFVGLYATGDEGSEYERGAVRFFDVAGAPPRSGRPRVEDTLDLAGFAQEIAECATVTRSVEWGVAESDEDELEP